MKTQTRLHAYANSCNPLKTTKELDSVAGYSPNMDLCNSPRAATNEARSPPLSAWDLTHTAIIDIRIK